MSTYSDLGFNTYRGYIESDIFARKKQYIKRTFPKSYYCWICDKEEHLDLHHEMYGNIPNEVFLVDVFWICRECHTDIHFDEFGEKIPLKTHHLRERRLYLRKQYLYKHIRPTTVFPITAKLIYRIFY